jgi:hypothetical protein
MGNSESNKQIQVDGHQPNELNMPPKKKSKTSMEEEDKGKKTDKKEEKQEEEDDEETEEEETDDEDRGRGKRKRRESKGFEPEDFTMASERAKRAAVVEKGRGMKLEDIPVVKAAIEKVALNSDDLPFAYTFVFSNRFKPTKKEMKQKLLEFSGYLPPLPKKKLDQEEQDANDEVHEVRVSISLYIYIILCLLKRRSHVR